MIRLLRSLKLLDRGAFQVRYLLPVYQGQRFHNLARARWLVGRPLTRRCARGGCVIFHVPPTDRYARLLLRTQLAPLLPCAPGVMAGAPPPPPPAWPPSPALALFGRPPLS